MLLCAREICCGVQIIQHGAHGVCSDVQIIQYGARRVCSGVQIMKFGDNDLLFNHKTGNALVKVILKNPLKSTFLDYVVLD